jgi:hypothetical protein
MRALHGAGGGLDSVGGVSISRDDNDNDGIAGSTSQPVASFNAYELEAMDLDLSAGACGQEKARAANAMHTNSTPKTSILFEYPTAMYWPCSSQRCGEQRPQFVFCFPFFEFDG